MQFGGFIIFPFSLALLEFLVQMKSTEITIIIISAGAFLLLFHNRERLTIAVVVEHEKNTRIFTAIKHKKKLWVPSIRNGLIVFVMYIALFYLVSTTVKVTFKLVHLFHNGTKSFDYLKLHIILSQRFAKVEDNSVVVTLFIRLW